jgi:Tfp pilus assembly protein PilV
MALTEGARRAGFTIVEVIIALVVLTVVGVAMAAANQHAARILQRSRIELNAARFLEAEVERLRILPFTSLSDGQHTQGRGIATWTVVDSTSYRRLLLETRYGSAATGMIVDSVTIYRAQP